MAAAATGETHELWVFDADELTEDLIKLNERLKDSIRADIIALALFLKSARQSVQQIRLLGVMGRAYLKLGRNGRLYIIFKGLGRMRPDLRGSRYLASNPKVACFVIGGPEIVRDAAKATKIAVVLLVTYDIVREMHEDRFSLASLGVRVLSDVLQAAGAAAVGAVIGVAFTTVGLPVVAVFAIVIISGFAAGVIFTAIDQKFGLTDRARARMMEYENALGEKLNAAERLIASVIRLAKETQETIFVLENAWSELGHLPRISLLQMR